MLDEREQFLELAFCFAGKADDERRANGEFRADRTPSANPLEIVLRVRRPFHQLENARARVLERNVEIRQQPSLRHQRDDLVDVRIRIDIMQAHPRTVLFRELGQGARKLGHPRLHGAPAPETGAIPDVDAVGARVLRDDQQLSHAGFQENLRFVHHFAQRPAHQIAAQRRNDAKAAAVIAAFRDLEVGVVFRRELDSLGRDQIDERIVRLRQLHVDRVHHFGRRVRAGHREDFRVRPLDERAAVPGAEAAGDDDLAVLGQRLADR